MPKILLYFFVCCAIPFSVAAQSITITGRVTDVETEEGICFATVSIKGTDSTVSADCDGYYKIILKTPADFVGATCIGYEKGYIPIKKSVHEETINFELERAADNDRQKAALRKSQDAALDIMRRVIRHKSSHNRKNLNSYGYEAYTKMQIDLIDLTERFKKRKVFKPFQFVFHGIDSTSEVKPFLPFFLTETVSDYYYQKRPFASRETIKASRVSGVDDLSITQFLGSSSVQADIYSEYIVLLKRQFISPVSLLGMSAYIYYLEDSQLIDRIKCYKIRFTPRSQKLAQLEGEMWVAASYSAIRRISLRMQNNSKVDPIRSISLYNEFIPIGDSVWMLRREKISIYGIKFKNTPELVLRKNTFYKNFVINEKKHTLDSVFRSVKPVIAVADSANFKSDAYWATVRRGASSAYHEDKVYNMIDTLASLKVTKRYINLIQAALTGYVDVGPLSIGNIYSFIGHNHVEGWRFKYGMRTSTRLSKVIRLGAYAEYGVRDRKAHYGAEALWLIRGDPRISVSASYRFDLTPTLNYNSFYVTPDLLTTYGLRRVEDGHFIPLKLMQLREAKLKFHHEFKFGYSYTLGILDQQVLPVDDFNFSYHTAADNKDPNTDITSGTVTEFSMVQRFAWQERFLTSNFARYSLGSKYPIVSFALAIGVKSLLGSQFDYQKLSAVISDTRLLGLLGRLKYDIEAGKIFGTLPFLFMQIPDASETYISVWPGFNTITKYQFAADRYVKVMAEHHLDGLLLDRIPGIRRLRLREVWGAHMWWGDMTQANRTANYADLAVNPANTGLIRVQTTERMPFIEMNAGVENILSFFRLDAVWRATYLDPRGTRFSFRYGNCGVRLSFALQF